MWPDRLPLTSPTLNGLSWPEVHTVSKVLLIAPRWPPVATRSRSWRTALTACIRWVTVNCCERVADLGLLISEVPQGAVPTRHRFIARARLMAALSAPTVVVEAGVRSGAMTVARRAHELRRAVGLSPAR